jgi:parallel beta-helix repeat protein
MNSVSSTKAADAGANDPLHGLDEVKTSRDIIRVDRDWDEEDQAQVDPNVKCTKSIGDALAIAAPGSIIQIAAGNYSESLVIKTPNLIIESLEEDGKVVILSSKKPCLTIAIDEESNLEINRIRMIFKGPNSQSAFTQKVDMNYEKVGNEECINEFHMYKTKNNFTSPKKIPAVILAMSGNLSLNRCVLSLNGVAAHMTEKIPCVACYERVSLVVNNCSIYGDSHKEVITTGILVYDGLDVTIKDSVVMNHLGGGIMIRHNPELDSKYRIVNSKILQCETAGIYIEGNGCHPEIEGNEVKGCRAVGIKISTNVLAEIRENQIIENNDGIELFNNKSQIVANEIEKSHGHGILIVSTNKDGKYNPMIKGNTISNCKFNGIQISGEGLRATVTNNTVKNNRKCGIKVMDGAVAHIVGRNFIHTNYTQGICIMEHSSCKIVENTITKNLKANIAFGGKGSGHTKIERNEISKSMAEGIFLVKGEGATFINEIVIRENLDGIAL